MAQARGSKAKLIYDTESVYKTIPSSSAAWTFPLTSESLKLSRNLHESNIIRGIRVQSTPVRGTREVAGDINMLLCPQIDKLLYHTLGTVSTVGSSVYTHTFTISDLPAGMTIEKQFTDLGQYVKYFGCKVNSFKMSFKPEGFIETTVNIMGAGETITTSSFASGTESTSSSPTPFDGFEIVLTDGVSTLAVVTELEINIENNLDGSVFVLDGTGERYSLPEGNTKVSGTLKALFEDLTLYNKAVNHTETSLIATITKGTGVGTVGNEKMIITISELVFEPNSPQIEGPGGLLIDLPFIGYYTNGADANTSIKITLRDALDSTYMT